MNLRTTEILARHQSSLACLAALIASLFSLACFGADDTDQQPTQSLVQVSDDTMSIAVEGAVFEEVIAEVALQGDFKISLTTDESMGFVTASFTGVPMIEGLRRLLGDRSHVLVFSEAGSVPHLVQVLVMSGASDTGMAGQASGPVSEVVYVQPDEVVDPASFQLLNERIEAEFIAAGGAVASGRGSSAFIAPSLPGQTGIDPLSSPQRRLADEIISRLKIVSERGTN